MDDLTLKLKLLSGESLEIDKNLGSLKPLTVREIISYGYTDYLMMLNMLTLDLGDLIDLNSPDASNIENLKINVFDVMVQMGGDQIIKELENSLSLFFRNVVQVDKESYLISIGLGDDMKVIDRENFDKVREVIKWQNMVNKFGEDDALDAEDSDAVKAIKEKIKKRKEVLSKVKQDDGESEFDLADIISAISSKSNSLSKLNIFNLTIFQLYDEFKRLELIDQYHMNIKSMLAGAKDVKLKHWSSKLD